MLKSENKDTIFKKLSRGYFLFFYRYFYILLNRRFACSHSKFLQLKQNICPKIGSAPTPQDSAPKVQRKNCRRSEPLYTLPP